MYISRLQGKNSLTGNTNTDPDHYLSRDQLKRGSGRALPWAPPCWFDDWAGGLCKTRIGHNFSSYPEEKKLGK